MKRIFIGPKQSTIKYTNFFDYSITLVGDNKNNNIAYKDELPFEFWNPDNEELEINIYNNEMLKITFPAEVMAHNPNLLSKCNFPNHIKLICKNRQDILEILDNKIKTRKLMENIVPMLEYFLVKGSSFDYKSMSTDISSGLVIQLPIGSGGSKTFFCNDKNYLEISSFLQPNCQYSVSVYKSGNVPYNIHCIIGKEQIELLPPSKQILEISEKIEYIGSEYDVEISTSIKKKIREYSNKICKKLQSIGYLGVLGIDYIEYDNELYFIEINPRFQGSTPQLDILLQENNLPSIFEYNYLAFKGEKLPTVKK